MPTNGRIHSVRNAVNDIWGGLDPLTRNQLKGVIQNALLDRKQWLNQATDPRRSINDECGYPETYSLGADAYRALYDREPLATRTCQLMPKECWQVSPAVYESEDPEEVTPFEEAWDALGQQLRGEQCWYQDEMGSPIWEHLERADILSGIGHFGVLLLGIADGKTLDQPVEGVVQYSLNSEVVPAPATEDKAGFEKLGIPPTKGLTQNEVDEEREWIVANNATSDTRRAAMIYNYNPSVAAGTDAYYDAGGQVGAGLLGKREGTDAFYVGVQLSPPEFPAQKPSKQKRRLMFLRAYDEILIQIVQYEADIRNPRFGMPVMYRITLNDPREQHSGIGLPIATLRVHWSRVIHLADNRGSSEIFGVPRMRPVINPILDAQKVCGADAEAFWKNCLIKLFLTTHPQLGGDAMIDVPGMRDDLENFVNGLQGWAATAGLQAQSIAPSVVDPTSHLDIQVQRICIQLACPVRVFKGAERGELASSQDDADWNGRVAGRHNNYLTPRVIVPFVDRLISAGVLPVPGDGAKKKVQNALVANRRGASIQVRNAYFKNPITKVVRHTGWVIHNAEAKTQEYVSKSGYSVTWPDMDSTTDMDKARIGQTRTAALTQFIQGGGEQAITLHRFLTSFLYFSDEEAQSMVEETREAHDQEETMTMPPGLGAEGPQYQQQEQLSSDQEEEQPTENALTPPPGPDEEGAERYEPDDAAVEAEDHEQQGKRGWW